MMLVENVENRLWIVTTVFAVAVTFVLPVENARILAIETVPGKSHWNFMSAVLRALTDGGHSVTVFTPFPEGDRDNYTEVDTSDRFNMVVNMGLTDLMRSFGDLSVLIPAVIELNRQCCDALHGNRRLNEFLGAGLSSRFDAIIIEPGMADCLTFAAAALEDVPLIYSLPWANSFASWSTPDGDRQNPAVVSTMFARYGVPETFGQRFSNTLTALLTGVLTALHETAMKIVDPKPYDSYVPVLPSLVIANGHHIIDASRPISPNTVNVGGIHLKHPGNIPNDILEFIEDSPHGVILFTFGSTVLMSSLPNQMKTAFLEALAQLPQRILLKYEAEMDDKPKNVMIRKWFPQRDIIAHPKVKLFVSHGGVSGVYEAVDAGVPVLGFPLFADQHRNIDNLVRVGMAISMDILFVSTDSFLKNAVELVNNEKYMENAKIASKIFKDRPLSPQQSVVYWVEYVIRHKGASHLKSQALDLTWYQYLLLDVLSVLFILISIVVFVICMMFKIIYQYSFKHSRVIVAKRE